jgi:hypothetical protein
VWSVPTSIPPHWSEGKRDICTFLCSPDGAPFLVSSLFLVHRQTGGLVTRGEDMEALIPSCMAPARAHSSYSSSSSSDVMLESQFDYTSSSYFFSYSPYRLLPYRRSGAGCACANNLLPPPFSATGQPGAPLYLGTTYNLLANLVAQIRNAHPAPSFYGGDGMGFLLWSSGSPHNLKRALRPTLTKYGGGQLCQGRPLYTKT